MSDISLEISWLEWVAIAVMVGWPGLIIGAVLGAAGFWKKTRILAAVAAAVIGCGAWFASVLLLK